MGDYAHKQVSRLLRAPNSLTSQTKERTPNQPNTHLAKKMKLREINERREKVLATRTPAFVQNYLLGKTYFNLDEIKTLQLMYQAFKEKNSNDHKKIDRLRFRAMVASLFGISNNVMLDRIFNAFDADNEGTVSETEWIIGLSALLRGTMDQQIAYTYAVYDINGDRSLGREEVINCLKGCMYSVPGVLDVDEVEEASKDIADLVMKRFDINHDSYIMYPEYRHIIKNDPLLLEVLGECLPEVKTAVPFTGLINANPRNFRFYLSRPGDPSWLAEKNRYSDYREDKHHEGFLDDQVDIEKELLKLGVGAGTAMAPSPSQVSSTGLSVLMKESKVVKRRKMITVRGKPQARSKLMQKTLMKHEKPPPLPLVESPILPEGKQGLQVIDSHNVNVIHRKALQK